MSTKIDDDLFLKLEEPKATPPPPPQSGDKCPRENCAGVLRTYSSEKKIEAGVIIRYLHCGKCGCRPANNKWIIPLRYAKRS